MCTGVNCEVVPGLKALMVSSVLYVAQLQDQNERREQDIQLLQKEVRNLDSGLAIELDLWKPGILLHCNVYFRA